VIAEDRARLLDLQRARLAQVQGQIAAIDRAVHAMGQRRERIAPYVYERDGRAQRHSQAQRRDCETCGMGGKPDADAIERANAYLRRLGVPEGLL
jgi:hypothetical protein